MWNDSFAGGCDISLAASILGLSESAPHGQVVDRIFRHYDLLVRQEDPQSAGRHDATHQEL
jgi:hypothetical protein